MRIRHVADNEPVDFRRLPPLEGTVLAKRLVAPRRHTPFPTGLVSAASVMLGLGVLIAFSSPIALAEKFALLGVSALPLLAFLSWHWRNRKELRWVSLATQFPTWNALVDALRTSAHAVHFRGEDVRESDHLFLGAIEGSGKPLLLHRVYLNRPAIILGRTGAGKTKLIAEPLLVQGIRRREMHFVTVDLKGDKTFMLGLAAEAARSRLNFKWLTLEPGKSSYLWNPFTDPGVQLLSKEQLVQIILRALSLVTGQEHGAGYFGAMQEERTRRTFEQHDLRSFRDFYRVVRNQRAADIGMSDRDFSSAGHLIANLARIASVGVLNAVPEDDIPKDALREAISTLDVLSRPGVTYLYLPAQLEPTTAMFLAKLWVHLLTAVAKVYEGRRVSVLVWNDEFQEMVGPDLATPIRQARESDVTFWMGFQDLAALETAQGNFTSAVLGNAPLKIFCTAEDEDGRTYVKETSGETIRPLQAVTATTTQTAQGWSQGTARQYREEAVPRIGDETINRVNRDPKAFIVAASESKGFTQFRFPVVARGSFHISEQEFARRQAMPWPRGNRFTVTVESASVNAEQPVAEPEALQAPQAVVGPATTPPPATEPSPAPRRRGRPAKRVKIEQQAAVEPAAEPEAQPPTTVKTPAARPPASDEMADYLKRLAEDVGGNSPLNAEPKR